ncbi:MAG: hypothetical protein EP343_06850 [Deltaproteobacteria bacterium]|nr:MAG: hypothetical protein EP343_06850 [Deltaproteobacteria bacterium]
MKSWFSVVMITLAIALLVLAIGAFALIRGFNYFPGPQEAAELVCNDKKAQPLSIKAGPLRVLSWNIQYSASRNYHFFYDGGKAVSPSKKDVEATIANIVKAVKKYNPDIILWQEVDRNSARTHQIDQLKKLLEGQSYPCWASTPYHRSVYVPTPSHQHMKRVDMHLAVFSRYPIKRATRHALPMLKESFLRRAFNLKRAVLEVEIPLKEGGSLTLLDTHFSAFSFGDGTMAKQVKKLSSLMEAADKAGNPWIASGDLNLVAPGFDPQKSLPKKEASYYPAKDKNPIKALYDKWTPALSPAEYNKSPNQYNTYVMYGKKQPDRWIDHTFVNSKTKVLKYKVLQEFVNISDHMPVYLEVQLNK